MFAPKTCKRGVGHMYAMPLSPLAPHTPGALGHGAAEGAVGVVHGAALCDLRAGEAVGDGTGAFLE